MLYFEAVLILWKHFCRFSVICSLIFYLVSFTNEKSLSYSAENNISHAESSSRKNWHMILRMKIGTNMKLCHLWPIYFSPLPSFPKLQNISWVKGLILLHFVLIKWWDALSYCCVVRSWHDSFNFPLCWVINEDFFLP